MSGVGFTLNIAKTALLAQRYAIDVTGHNIANVSTPGYSRQTAVMDTNLPVPYAGLIFGTGVDVDEIKRISDAFIEKRLNEQKSEFSEMSESETYMKVLEGLFDESSEIGINDSMTEFWNAWYDLSINPTGTPERTVVYEKASLLYQKLNSLNNSLWAMQNDINLAIDSGLEEINQITAEIASINTQIVGMETGRTANDLRDQRNTLLGELSEYVSISSFEQGNGSVTVVAGKGYVLVQENENYSLSMDEGDIKLAISTDSQRDVTDSMEGGKLGAWLELRDASIPEYRNNLDELARSIVFEVNKAHSQGVGLRLFNSDITGTYQADSSGLLSTLAYGDKIDYTKDFKMWINDGTTNNAVTVDMGISTSTATNWAGSGGADDKYTFTVTTGGTVGTGQQAIYYTNSGGTVTGTINVSGAGTYSTSDGIDFDVGAGTLVAGNTFTVNTDAAGGPDPLDMTVSGTANNVSDNYIFNVTTGGEIGTDTLEVEWSNDVTGGTLSIPAAGSYTVDGMTLNFTSGTLQQGDTFTVEADSDGSPAADLPSEWHWTMDSFGDRFNNLATGITASVTSDNKLKFSPGSGYSFGFCDDEFEASGLLAALGINTFFEGYSAGSIDMNSQTQNKDFIAAGKIDADTGDLAVGDNSNAVDIADIRSSSVAIRQFNCNRGSDTTSTSSTMPLDDFYNTLVSSVGIESASITRSKEFNNVLVSRLKEIREGISGVSLDEEMTNMIKFQHAYVAAAKLISTSDQMYATLLATR